MNHLLLVGAGGALGAMGRYLVSGLVHRLLPSTLFPAGTLSVNVLGCLAIGLLGGLADARGALSGDARLFVFIGILGGFTTFSTFAYETMALATDAEALPALANVGLHLAACLGAVWAGGALARAL
ncbi:MAG: fluoride efflux transporter CrcB [Gemmatimonadota bacterium]